MRRIKSLQQIAGTVANLPKTHSELCKLPGVGEYTGGAVLAFSHNIFVPILETNIRTVLCHHFCPKEESSCLAEKQYKEMLPILFTESGLSAKAFYEAMMDYGTYLKKEKTNVCSFKYKQKPFKGSSRELRAKILFAVTEGKEIERNDSRTEGVLGELVREGFIVKTATGYEIAP